MIHNLNAPDWASRHAAEEDLSTLFPDERPLEPSSLEMALRKMGLLFRPSEPLPPDQKN